MDIRQFNIILQHTAEGPFTIQIPLHTMSAYVVPREYVSEARNIAGIDRPGVYVLFGNGKIYIGQTRKGIARMDDHLIHKDWWEKAVLFLADNTQFDLDTISGLERTGIERAFDNSPYEVENKDKPNYEAKSLYNKMMLDSCYDDIEVVLNFLGIKTKKKHTSTPTVPVTEVPDDSSFLPLNSINSLRSKHIDGFKYNNEYHNVKNMTEAYVEITGILYDQDPSILKRNNFNNYVNEDDSAIRKSYMNPGMIKEFRTGIFINCNKSNDDKLAFLKSLVTAYSLSFDEIKLRVCD